MSERGERTLQLITKFDYYYLIIKFLRRIRHRGGGFLIGYLTRQAVIFFQDIKLAHSVFALPFAAVAVLMCGNPVRSVPWLALLVCVVSARTFAMGMNRIVDRKVDLANPRTRNRAIPSGQLPVRDARFYTGLAAAVFVAASATISWKVGVLSVPLLIILGAYGLMKQHTVLCHWYLGFCLGLAPVGVGVVLADAFVLSCILLAVGVCFWTAGFDILYATADYEFDRQAGLKSIPSSLGVRRAAYLSRACFVVAVVFFAMSGSAAGFGWLFFVGVAVAAAIFVYEHWLVRGLTVDGDTDRLDQAFFTMNALVSIVIYIFSQLDVILRPWFFLSNIP